MLNNESMLQVKGDEHQQQTGQNTGDTLFPLSISHCYTCRSKCRLSYIAKLKKNIEKQVSFRKELAENMLESLGLVRTNLIYIYINYLEFHYIYSNFSFIPNLRIEIGDKQALVKSLEFSVV